MGQSCFPAQQSPHLMDGGVGNAGLMIDEQVIELAFGIQLVQYINGGIVQRY